MRPRRTIAWLSWAAMGSLGGCFDADATRGLPCTEDESCGSLSCEYGICGGPTRCEAGAGVGDYCYVLTDEAFPVGEDPTALAVADVNSDFVRDIVTTDGGTRGVSVLIGDGSGVFATHDLGLPELPAVPTALGLGHLDGAGWSDIAVVTDTGGVHAVLIGDDGVLGSVAPVATAVARASRPTIADYVQDDSGVRDIAVLGEDGVFVARNVDLASFESTWRATTVDDPRDMLTIQDAAGDPSFAYVARVADDDISSLSHKADGTFSSGQSIPVGDGPISFAIADLNSDDYADALVVSSTGSLWLTKGKSADRDEWSPPERLYDLGWVPSTLDVLDLDDDGDPDVVVSGATPDGHSDVFLLENDGEGRMIYGGSLGLRDASAAALADLDGDGVPEVVITAADDDAVRLARRAKAPPMPGDDDGSDGDTTATSASSMTVDDSGEEVTGMTLDDGPPETGVDPTGEEQCFYLGNVGPVELARCSSLSAGGSHDQIGFSPVDEDFYDDIVVAVSDETATYRLVAFCSQFGYGNYGNYGDTTPFLCRDVPIPAPATGLAGGGWVGETRAIALTHTDGITMAFSNDIEGTWDLQPVGGAATGLGDPSFYDFTFDGASDLVFAGTEGVLVVQPDPQPTPTLVFSGAGAHQPRGGSSTVISEGEGPDLTTYEVVFAIEDVGDGISGGVLRTTFDPAAAAEGETTVITQDPQLLGLRAFEIAIAGPEGIFMLGVVGPGRSLATILASPVGPPLVGVNDAFSEVSALVLVNLDAEPVFDDVALIGSFYGAPPSLHVLVDDLEGVQNHLEIADITDARDLATWTVPCGDLGWTTELLVATAWGIERVRAVNGCS